jgi:predicted PurR-regulated permease PerM
VAGTAAVVSLTQFGSLEMACAVGAASLAIHAVIGNLLTPWWLGRASRMSALVVFVAVLLFGWLWGIPGLLLGVPILMIVKSICDHIEDLKPIGELLSA